MDFFTVEAEFTIPVEDFLPVEAEMTIPMEEFFPVEAELTIPMEDFLPVEARNLQSRWRSFPLEAEITIGGGMIFGCCGTNNEREIFRFKRNLHYGRKYLRFKRNLSIHMRKFALMRFPTQKRKFFVR